MARTSDQDTALRAVTEALDAGHDADGLLRVGPINPPKKKPGKLMLLLGMFGAQSYAKQMPKEPPAETSRRAANALDEFALQLHRTLAVLPDPALLKLGQDSDSWGSALWDRSRTYAEVYADFRPVMARLQEHQSHLIRGRDLPI